MSMWTYKIRNKITGETRIVQGVTVPNACYRNKLDIDEWDVLEQIATDDGDASDMKTYRLTV